MTEMKKRFFLPLNLQFFAADNGTDIGGGNEGDTDNQLNGNGADDTNAQGGGNTDDKNESKKFSQEDVDKLISDRLTREKKKYADYEELLTFKKQAEELAEKQRLENLSEIERAKEEAKSLQDKYSTLEQELATLRENNKKQTIVNEFIKLATQKQVAYIDDALLLAQNDLATIQIDENGKPTGVDSIVEALLTNKPYLVKQKEPQSKDIGGPSNLDPNKEVKTLEQQLAEAKKSKNFSLVVELSNKLKNMTKK